MVVRLVRQQRPMAEGSKACAAARPMAEGGKACAAARPMADGGKACAAAMHTAATKATGSKRVSRRGLVQKQLAGERERAHG